MNSIQIESDKYFTNDMNSIQIESDKDVSEFMAMCQCIYGFPLPAIDSRFVRRPIDSENVDEVLQINNNKIRNAFSITCRFISYLCDLKDFVAEILGEKFNVDVCHMFGYNEGWNFDDSFHIGFDGFTDFMYQVELKHWCQTRIVTFNEKKDHRVFTLETSIGKNICAGIKGKDSLRKQYEIYKCVSVPDSPPDVRYLHIKDGHFCGFQFFSIFFNFF